MSKMMRTSTSSVRSDPIKKGFEVRVPERRRFQHVDKILLGHAAREVSTGKPGGALELRQGHCTKVLGFLCGHAREIKNLDAVVAPISNVDLIITIPGAASRETELVGLLTRFHPS